MCSVFTGVEMRQRPATETDKVEENSWSGTSLVIGQRSAFPLDGILNTLDRRFVGGIQGLSLRKVRVQASPSETRSR